MDGSGNINGMQIGSFFDHLASGGSIWDHDLGFLPTSSSIDELIRKSNYFNNNNGAEGNDDGENKNNSAFILLLEDLLDEEELLQEVKSMHNDLLSILSKKENIIKLIDYITLPPDPQRIKSVFDDVIKKEEAAAAAIAENKRKGSDDDDSQADNKDMVHEKREYEDEDYQRMSLKFPYVASEVFCCDVNSIIAPVVEDREMLTRFFQILDQPSPLDPRMAGYFHKVLSVFLHHNPEAILRYVLDNQSVDSPSTGIVSKLLKHIDSYSISSNFMQFLTCCDQQLALIEEVGDEQRSFDDVFSPVKVLPDVSYTSVLIRSRNLWSGGEGTAQQVLEALRTSKNSDSCANAADLLSDMFRRAAKARKDKKDQAGAMVSLNSTEDQDNQWTLEACKELIKLALNQSIHVEMESPETFQKLSISAQAVVTGENPVTNASFKVLIQMIQAFSNDHFINKTEEAIIPELQLVSDSLPDFCKLLKGESEKDNTSSSSSLLLNSNPKIETQWGGKIKKLGAGRLLIVEIISNLVQSRCSYSLEAINNCKENPLGICLDLFFEFEWHNILHGAVYKMVSLILQGGNIAKKTTAVPIQSQQPKFQSLFSSMSKVSLSDPSNDANNAAFESEKKVARLQLLSLQECLFNNCKLLDRIANAYHLSGEAVGDMQEHHRSIRNESSVSPPLPTPSPSPKNDKIGHHGSKGYMGYVHQIANACAKLMEEELQLQKQQQEGNIKIEEENEKYPATTAAKSTPTWSELVESDLFEVNIITSRPLGGAKPDINAMVSGAAALGFSMNLGGSKTSVTSLDELMNKMTGGSYDDDEDDEDDEREDDEDEDDEGHRGQNPHENKSQDVGMFQLSDSHPGEENDWAQFDNAFGENIEFPPIESSDSEEKDDGL